MSKSLTDALRRSKQTQGEGKVRRAHRCIVCQRRAAGKFMTKCGSCRRSYLCPRPACHEQHRRSHGVA